MEWMAPDRLAACLVHCFWEGKPCGPAGDRLARVKGAEHTGWSPAIEAPLQQPAQHTNSHQISINGSYRGFRYSQQPSET